MTVVAWDGTTIAADSQSSYGDIRWLKPSIKIFDLGNGKYAASSGSAAAKAKFVEWCEQGRSPKHFPTLADDGCYIYIENKIATVYDQNGLAIETEPPIAMGIGKEFALGAMEAGANAAKAVAIAIKYSVWCGPPVLSFSTE